MMHGVYNVKNVISYVPLFHTGGRIIEDRPMSTFDPDG
jgi:hypothetical protein